MLSSSVEECNFLISIVKLDKDECQRTFINRAGMENMLYADERMLVYSANPTYCVFTGKYDDEHIITGQISWHYVGETGEHAEQVKKLDAFLRAIGVPNPIEIVEENAGKLQ